MSKHVDRRWLLQRGALTAAGLAVAPGVLVRAAPRFDLVVRGGMVLDGTGTPARAVDIGLMGDSIVAIDSIDPAQGRKVLDATGLHVAPGFIDIHSHSDDSIFRYPTADSRVLQGVTTEITGNCGYSAAPIAGEAGSRRREYLAEEYGIEATWDDVASYFEALADCRISVNQALLLGQGVLRENIVGEDDRPATAEERAAMLRAVEEGMDQGAFGLSTGLEYAPGIFTPTEEIVSMARVAARRDGLYASHIRNEEAGVLGAVEEAIEIGRATGARVQVSHMKVAGKPNWQLQDNTLGLIEAARAAGVAVLADAYPYGAYSTGLTILLPAWARDGGNEALLGRLREPAERQRLRELLPDRFVLDPGGPDLIVISSLRSAANRRFVGKSLTEIAATWRTDPADAMLRLLDEEEAEVGYVGHGMSAENVERVLSHPLVMIGSDGASMAPEGPAAARQPHPRSYGTFPRVLGHFVRERGLFDLATAVRKMTSMPAEQVGLADRGRIAQGMKADLVLFDASTVADEATYDDPHRYPTGIRHVLVNGEPVVAAGEHTGARPGRILRKA